MKTNDISKGLRSYEKKVKIGTNKFPGTLPVLEQVESQEVMELTVTGPPGGLLEVEITEIFPDYLVYKDSTETDQPVLKPYLLRQSHFDDETVNGIFYTYPDPGDGQSRTASQGGVEEQQRITPSYYVGETLLIGETTLLGGFVMPVDVNNSGRCWAVEE